MPIYVFRCDNCGEEFERLQKMSDPDPDVCPHCGKRRTVHRQVTAPSFRLAGRGWYETDFKSEREHRHNLAGDAAKPKRENPTGEKAKAASGESAKDGATSTKAPASAGDGNAAG